MTSAADKHGPWEEAASRNPDKRVWEWQPWLGLAAVCLLLNLTFNATFPARAAFSDWLRPAWETTLLLVAFSWCVLTGRRIRGWQYNLLALGLLALRLLRFVDGFYVRFFHRSFRLAVDLPLLPESVRLLLTTDGVILTLLQLAVLLALVLLVFWILKRALLEMERSLLRLFASEPRTGSEPRSEAGQRERKAPSFKLGACGLIGAVSLAPLHQTMVRSVEHESASARIAAEVHFLLDYPQLRQRVFARFEQVSARMAQVPQNLARLNRRDVTLIMIESYGRGALDTRQHQHEMQQALAKFQGRLSGRGWSVASRWLLSPSYGGGSWYAHATLSTGVKVWSPLDYDLLLESDVIPLSRYLANAGYHTVHVMPGTTRVWPREGFYGFDQKIYAKDFEYAGPDFSWGRFPDQYVLDQVRRKFGGSDKPTYKEIKLVSSHVPWQAVPSVVANWDQIGNGALYHQLPAEEFALRWSNLENAHWPYVASIIYDLDVVGSFVEQFEKEDALVIVMGDHQPVNQAGRSDSWDVPIHVMGRHDLVSLFQSRGFEPGLRPRAASEPLPMEEFLPLFLATLSAPPN